MIHASSSLDGRRDTVAGRRGEVRECASRAKSTLRGGRERKTRTRSLRLNQCAVLRLRGVPEEFHACAAGAPRDGAFATVNML